MNRDTGALIPVNASGFLPTPGQQETSLSEVVITQFLSERFAIFASKLQIFEGDMNQFAHGRGKTQFMNLAFVANPIAFRTVPYASLGVGFMIVKGLEPLVIFTAIDPVDRTTTFDLDNVFENGVTLNLETRLPTTFFGMPGHQFFGAIWSSRDVAHLSQRPVLSRPPYGFQLQLANGSWAL